MSEYVITSPDGKEYVVTAPEGASQDDVLNYAKGKFSPEGKPDSKAGGWWNLAAPLEAAMSLGSGMIATPLSGAAGVAGTLLPGKEGQGADWVRKTQETLTYEPLTSGGELLTKIASLPGLVLSKAGNIAGEKTADITGSPMLGAGVNAAIQATPAIMGAGKMVQGGGVPTRLQENVKAAREAGFKLTPDEMGASGTARSVAGLSGEPKLSKLVSLKNKEVANNLIAGDFGLPQGTSITRQVLEGIRESQGASYDAVRGAGRVVLDGKLKSEVAGAARDLKQAASELPHRTENPLLKTVDSILGKGSLDASTIVSEIINLRSEAKAAFSKQEAQVGRGNLAIAEALEGVLDRHLTRTGNPQALSALREARATIAKTYAADKAINPVTGDFNPQAYATMLKNKVPLTGGAKKIAETATAFPRSMQNPSGLPPPGASFFDLFLGRGLGLPAGVDLITAGVRPGMRSWLSSGPAQAVMAGPEWTPGILAAIAASQAQQRQEK